MKIILSTYAFYPYAAGGTEVYTSEMAAQLTSRGHQILIVAGWSGEAAAQEQLIWEDESVKAGQYHYAGIAVLGIHLKQQTAEAVYANETPAWTAAFVEILIKTGWGDAALLVMNGVSTVSGVSLFKALLQLHPAARLSVIMHTPFVCAKADMMFARTSRRCQQTITATTCAACVTATSTGLPFVCSKLVNSIANNSVFTAVSSSAFFRQHRLLQLKIAGLQWLNEKTDRWIVFSDDMRVFLGKQQFINEAKVRVIRHGIDKNIFYPPAVRPPQTPYIFLYAGRFETIKGVDLLCEAWEKLPGHPAVRQLYLAGNWQQTATGRRVHAVLGLRKDVVFMDALPQNELADLYRRVHCVIIPSRWVETGPLVMHEAIECGCDVISSDIGGQAELAALYTGKSQVFNLQHKESLHQLLLTCLPTAIAPLQRPWSAAAHFEAVCDAIDIAG